MGLDRKKKICKACEQERYIYAKGKCQSCYRFAYAQEHQRKQKRTNLFNEVPQISQGKKNVLRDFKSRSKLNAVSKSNKYYDSDGNAYTSKEVEVRIRKAKAELLQNQLDEHGYNFCEECRRNDCKPVECSHDISVKWAKEHAQVELCWSVDNMTPRGRPCHQEYDKNAIKGTPIIGDG